jgi:hypothetical protein
MDKKDILIENYKIIHGAVQDSHRHAWAMTGIFVPVIAAGLCLFFKENRSIGLLALWGFGLAIVITCGFWYYVMAYLRGCNRIRILRLRELEDEISHEYGGGKERSALDYYNRMSEVKSGDERISGKRFSRCVKCLLISVIVLVFAFLIIETLSRVVG